MKSELKFESRIKSITSTAYAYLKNIARIRGVASKPGMSKVVALRPKFSGPQHLLHQSSFCPSFVVSSTFILGLV